MPGLQTVELKTAAGAIHCSACEQRIEALLGQLPGVRQVAADHRTQRVALTLDPELTSVEEAKAKLEFLGFPLASQPAEEEMSTGEAITDPSGRRARAKGPHWDTVCNVCAGGVSVVCMSSMAAATAGAGAAAGASAASMAAMGAMGAMGAMAGAVSETSTAGTSFGLLPSLFEAVGLGVLNRVPNEVAQPMLAAVLAFTIGAGYLTYRSHRRPWVLGLTTASAVVMYASIYFTMSEPLYFVSLAGLLAAGAWAMLLARTPVPQ